MKDQRIFCHDILDRIARIERYTAEGRAAFMESELLQDGVIRSFEVIGEAIKRMEPTLLATRTDVIWSDFAGFRDVLIHQYEKVRLNLVWEFSQEDLPPLKAAILALLATLPPEDERC
ncbi:MAG: HepT-like ribonuclease domain-containing protein [Chloroflexota bacterium]|nr:HepT-like ribonuclease domain-containing protein [Chloroflexota bacterium]